MATSVLRAQRRRLASLGALLMALCLLPACSALDELDKANAVMKTKEPKKQDEAAAKPPAKIGEEWWKSATSLASGEKDPSLTSCRLEGRTQFMRKNDCLARGGRPN